MKTASNANLDFPHVIRERLTSIALCANSLQFAFASKLSREQVQAFGVIQSSVSDIKTILDQLENCDRTEMLPFGKDQRRNAVTALPMTPSALVPLPKAPAKAT